MSIRTRTTLATATAVILMTLTLTGISSAQTAMSVPASRPTPAFLHLRSIATTVRPDSVLRTAPHVAATKVASTKKRDDAEIRCWDKGSDVNDGHTHTNVWYYFNYVQDPTGIYQNVWSWGGNVSTDRDPPQGLPRC